MYGMSWTGAHVSEESSDWASDGVKPLSGDDSADSSFAYQTLSQQELSDDRENPYSGPSAEFNRWVDSESLTDMTRGQESAANRSAATRDTILPNQHSPNGKDVVAMDTNLALRVGVGSGVPSSESDLSANRTSHLRERVTVLERGTDELGDQMGTVTSQCNRTETDENSPADAKLGVNDGEFASCSENVPALGEEVMQEVAVVTSSGQIIPEQSNTDGESDYDEEEAISRTINEDLSPLEDISNQPFGTFHGGLGYFVHTYGN